MENTTFCDTAHFEVIELMGTTIRWWVFSTLIPVTCSDELIESIHSLTDDLRGGLTAGQYFVVRYCVMMATGGLTTNF